MTITKKEIRNADNKLLCHIGFNEQNQDGMWHIKIKRGKIFTDLFLYGDGAYAQMEIPEESLLDDDAETFGTYA